MRKCWICKGDLSHKRPQAKYCSIPCRKRANSISQRNWRHRHREAEERARIREIKEVALATFLLMAVIFILFTVVLTARGVIVWHGV